jgi:hypothetical protein
MISMFDKELVDYIRSAKEQAHINMRKNNEMGREDFYPLGQIAAFDQILQYLYVKESLHV